MGGRRPRHSRGCLSSHSDLRLQYPHLLPPEVIKDWDSRLPMDIRTISPELFTTIFPEGIDLLLASPPTLAHHLPRSHRVHTPMDPDVVRHILHLILHFSEAHPGWDGDIYVLLSSILAL